MNFFFFFTITITIIKTIIILLLLLLLLVFIINARTERLLKYGVLDGGASASAEWCGQCSREIRASA
jgi:hypothetical protein